MSLPVTLLPDGGHVRPALPADLIAY